MIREVRPDVVLGHDPWKRYRLHPDHRHAGLPGRRRDRGRPRPALLPRPGPRPAPAGLPPAVGGRRGRSRRGHRRVRRPQAGGAAGPPEPVGEHDGRSTPTEAAEEQAFETRIRERAAEAGAAGRPAAGRSLQAHRPALDDSESGAPEGRRLRTSGPVRPYFSARPSALAGAFLAGAFWPEPWRPWPEWPWPEPSSPGPWPEPSPALGRAAFLAGAFLAGRLLGRSLGGGRAALGRHDVLEGGADGELHTLAGRDPDGRAGAGVAGRAGLALRLAPAAETGEGNLLALLHRLLNGIDEGADDLLDFSLAQSGVSDDLVHQLGLVHQDLPS